MTPFILTHTTMPNSALPLALGVVLALAACSGDDPAHEARRTTAHRDACVAEELAIQANSKISSLDTIRMRAPEGFVTQIYPFARAYFDYAKIRERQTAWTDSAASAATPEDSARYAVEAARIIPAPGQPGSMAANAVESYNRDFATALSNPDHPCNSQNGDEK